MLCADIALLLADTALLASFFGFPAFQKHYGEPYDDDGVTKYAVVPRWQLGLGVITPVGQIVGVFLNGILVDRFGYKKVFLGALAMLSGTIFLQFFAVNIGMLMAGQFLVGDKANKDAIWS